MLDKCDCLPVIGLIIGSTSAEDLFASGMISVEKLARFSLSIFISLVASFSGTTLTKPSSEIALKPLTCIVLR